jgi:hypothetical protein
MPEVLRHFLATLPVDDARKLHNWLDSNPLAIDEMIALTIETQYAAGRFNFNGTVKVGRR